MTPQVGALARLSFRSSVTSGQSSASASATDVPPSFVLLATLVPPASGYAQQAGSPLAPAVCSSELRSRMRL